MSIMIYVFIGLLVALILASRFISENKFKKLDDESKIKLLDSFSLIRKFSLIPVIVFFLLFLYFLYSFKSYYFLILFIFLLSIFVYMVSTFVFSLYKLKKIKIDNEYFNNFLILGLLKNFLFLCLIIFFLVLNFKMYNKKYSGKDVDAGELYSKTDMFEKKIEADEWFNTNKNEYSFASNRFDSNENARKFIDELYKLGAKKIYITNIMEEDWRIKEEGGPYADSLIVVLPDDKKQRKEIFMISSREAINEGFKPEEDNGQQELFFWWD